VNYDWSYWSWWRFTWGAVGAAAPELLRLYNIVTGRTREPLNFRRSYFLISPAFLVMGGFFSVAWGEDPPFKCIWVGLSLPVIISAYGRKPPM